VTRAMNVTLANGTPAEGRMRDLLSELLLAHPLDGWIFTDRIRIAEGANPHSHPVLTMNTAHTADSRMALAEFLHEQLHWFEEAHVEQRDRFIEATGLRYPEVPAARPEGAGDETSTRLHLLVCHLEHQALASLIGAEAARATVQRLSAHHYSWVYRTILKDAASIDDLARRHGLIPAPLLVGS